MNCFFCNENMKTKTPKHKVGGQWAHITCPNKKSYKKMRKEKLKQEAA